MKHHTTPATQLDQVRGRRIAVAIAGMAGLAMLIGSPAAAGIVDPGPPCAGFTEGLPDGCWEPPQSPDEPIRRACAGFTGGLPDGCWESPQSIGGAGTTEVLPLKITRIPPNVR